MIKYFEGNVVVLFLNLKLIIDTKRKLNYNSQKYKNSNDTKII